MRARENVTAQTRRSLAEQLPQRMAALGRYGIALCESGWDINVALLLADDAERLADISRRLGDKANADQLETLAEHFWRVLDPPVIPQADTLDALLEALEQAAARADTSALETKVPIVSALIGHAASEENGFPLLVRPPQNYWQRFANTPRRVDREAKIGPAATTAPATPATPPAESVRSDNLAEIPAAPLEASRPAPEPQVEIEAETTAPLRAIHLDEQSPLSREIDQKLEALGYNLKSVPSIDALKEQLSGRTPPSLVVLGHAYLAAVEEIAALSLAARARSGYAVRLVALSERGDIATRLRAMRAGCDALIVLPTSADEVIARVRELGANDAADPYRILIVEDDRAQALFAEAILRKNGMQTLVVCEAAPVLEQLDAFRPDLILMDLHMPGCDGLELTALIREREAYVSTPIVFLSGESDSELQFSAIDAGGDDFLCKPIAPKHLITAVSSRVRRARQIERRRRATTQSAPTIEATRHAMLEPSVLSATAAAPEPPKASANDSGKILNALQTAVGDSSYRMVYQPIVSLHGEEDEQFQALLRLTTQDGRTYAASELIPVAEQAGLIATIDQWALEHCIAAIADHLRSGRTLRLFVSQSLASVRDPYRVTWLREKLESQRVPAGQLSIELRVKDALEALAEVVAFTIALKQIGVSVTLSGYEAGIDADDMLAHLPLSFVKLSSRYTSAEDETLRAELRDLVKAAHENGRQVIAPRVEEARIAAALWSSGVDLIQGNFVQQAAREMSYDFHAAAT